MDSIKQCCDFILQILRLNTLLLFWKEVQSFSIQSKKKPSKVRVPSFSTCGLPAVQHAAQCRLCHVLRAFLVTTVTLVSNELMKVQTLSWFFLKHRVCNVSPCSNMVISPREQRALLIVLLSYCGFRRIKQPVLIAGAEWSKHSHPRQLITQLHLGTCATFFTDAVVYWHLCKKNL